MKKKMTTLLSAMLCAAMVFTAPISVCQADEPDKRKSRTENRLRKIQMRIIFKAQFPDTRSFPFLFFLLDQSVLTRDQYNRIADSIPGFAHRRLSGDNILQ